MMRAARLGQRLRWVASATLGACLLNAGAAEPSGAAISPQRARSLYLLNCAGCHGVGGAGVPQFGVPSMIGMLGRFPQTPAGRAYLVQVPGARNSALTDAELAAVTNWALHKFSPETLPPDFQPYTTAEVQRWRSRPPLDIEATRTAIMGQW